MLTKLPTIYHDKDDNPYELVLTYSNVGSIAKPEFVWSVQYIKDDPYATRLVLEHTQNKSLSNLELDILSQLYDN